MKSKNCAAIKKHLMHSIRIDSLVCNVLTVQFFKYFIIWLPVVFFMNIGIKVLLIYEWCCGHGSF